MTTQTDSELIVLLFELVILITVTFRKFINAYLVLFNLLQNLQTFHSTTYKHYATDYKSCVSNNH